MRVFVHVGKGNKMKQKGYKLERLPAVGELISLDGHDVNRVQLVLHCPFNANSKRKSDYDAEIYVLPADMAPALREAGVL